MFRLKPIIGVVSSVIGFVFMWWLQSLLTPLFEKLNPYLVEKSTDPILQLINLIVLIMLVKMPAYSILLFAVIVLVVYKLISKIVIRHRNFKITKARYGSGSLWVDITGQLNSLIVENKLDITLSNSICGYDPVPHTLKVGEITYQLGKSAFNKKYKEGDKIKLP